jgi:hypothetical protein
LVTTLNDDISDDAAGFGLNAKNKIHVIALGSVAISCGTPHHNE